MLYAVLQDRLRAGRSFSIMTAGLQRHIKLCLRRILRAVFKRIPLRMQPAVIFVPAFRDDTPFFDDDASDHRVGRCMSHPVLSQFKRPPNINLFLNVIFLSASFFLNIPRLP